MVKITHHTPDAVLWNDDSDAVARLVGYFFMAYSLVEESIRGIYATLALRPDGPTEERAVVLSYIPMRNQIETIRSLIRLLDTDEDWARQIIIEVARFEPLITDRNKLAHQLWDEDGDGGMITRERGRRATRLNKSGLHIEGPKRVDQTAMESQLTSMHDIHRGLETAHLSLLSARFS